MENFAVTLSYLAIGALLARGKSFPKDAPLTLNTYVIYVALPALVFREVPRLTFNQDLLLPAIMPWFLLGVCALAVILVSRFLRWSREVTGALLLLSCLGNTSFLGVPVVSSFFGEGAVGYALIYDQLGSFLALSTFGALVLAFCSPKSPEDGNQPGARGILKKIITFPPFIALILASTILCRVELPSLAERVIASLAVTLVPVVMVAVGMQLRPRLEPGTLGPFAAGLAIKLVLSPMAALLVTRLAGQDGLVAQVTVLEAGMPPMVSAGAVALMAGMAPRLVASMVGLGIILSFITLPLLYRLL